MLGPVKQQFRRIGIAADSHGDWTALDAWATEHALDMVVHCGDCGTTQTRGIPVWAARGNHDPQGASDVAGPAGAAVRPQFVNDYQVRELGGLRWLFLGCLPGTAYVAPAPDTVPPASGVDVLVSHESPFNPHLGWPGHAAVRTLVERLQPQWCFSGHWHHAARATIGRTRCRALGADPSGWLVASVRHGALRLLDGANPSRTGRAALP